MFSVELITNTELISKSSLLLNIGGSKCCFEWLSLRRCVAGGSVGGAGERFINCTSSIRQQRQTRWGLWDSPVNPRRNKRRRSSAVAAMLCSAAAGTHTSAGQSSWLSAGFLVSLV